MANKKHAKANKIVQRATFVFGDAIEEVLRANKLLESEINEDQAKIQKARKEIESKQAEIDRLKNDQTSKRAQLAQNLDLIEKLKEFAPHK